MTLVQLVADQPRGLTLSEIGERCDLNFRTAQGLLRLLKELGMVDLDPRDKRYRLGPAVGLLMGSQSFSQILRPICADTVYALADALGQQVAIATIDHGELEIILQASNNSVASADGIGSQQRVANPLSMCAGTLLMAHGDSPVWRGAAPRVIERQTRHFEITDSAELQQRFATIRQQDSYLLEKHDGAWRAVLAVPVRFQGHVFAALATHLAMNDPRASDQLSVATWCEAHRQHLQRAADDMSARWAITGSTGSPGANKAATKADMPVSTNVVPEKGR